MSGIELRFYACITGRRPLAYMIEVAETGRTWVYHALDGVAVLYASKERAEAVTAEEFDELREIDLGEVPTHIATAFGSFMAAMVKEMIAIARVLGVNAGGGVSNTLTGNTGLSIMAGDIHGGVDFRRP